MRYLRHRKKVMPCSEPTEVWIYLTKRSSLTLNYELHSFAWALVAITTLAKPFALHIVHSLLALSSTCFLVGLPWLLLGSQWTGGALRQHPLSLQAQSSESGSSRFKSRVHPQQLPDLVLVTESWRLSLLLYKVGIRMRLPHRAVVRIKWDGAYKAVSAVAGT